MNDTISKISLMANPGSALRALRKEKGWTLAEVSKRTGLPASALSKIETGKTSPTFVKLVAISKGLGVDISQLFSPQSAPAPVTTSGRRSIGRAGEGRWLEFNSYNQMYPASDFLNKCFSPIFTDVRVTSLEEHEAEFGPMIGHPGEEFTYVLDGEVDLYSEIYGPLTLKTGDWVYFDSSAPHAYIARGSKPARLISVCSVDEGHFVERLQYAARTKKAANQTSTRQRVEPVKEKQPIRRSARK